MPRDDVECEGILIALAFWSCVGTITTFIFGGIELRKPTPNPAIMAATFGSGCGLFMILLLFSICFCIVVRNNKRVGKEESDAFNLRQNDAQHISMLNHIPPIVSLQITQPQTNQMMELARLRQVQQETQDRITQLEIDIYNS